MSRPLANSANVEPVRRLLYDTVTAAHILSLSPGTIGKLCDEGELQPCVTVGNRRLFSARDLEQFALAESPKQIQLEAARNG